MTKKLCALAADPNGEVTVIGPEVADAGTVATIVVGPRTEKVAPTPLNDTLRT